MHGSQREREKARVDRVLPGRVKWACRVLVIEQSQVDGKEGDAATLAFKILPRAHAPASLSLPLMLSKGNLPKWVL
jgi:hypothetical protein